MKLYTCVISSDASFTREYTVASSSALKCAKVLGRHDSNETISVYQGRRLVSRVKWDAESRRYIRATIPGEEVTAR